MDIQGNLSADSRVFLALCGSEALTPGGLPQHTIPLVPAEWARLGRALAKSGLSGPSELAALRHDEIAEALSVTQMEAGRLTRLLTRLEVLDEVLQRLAVEGIWPTTILDPAYPVSIRLRLGMQAPLVLFGRGNSTLAAREAVAIVGSRNVEERGAIFATEAARKLAEARVVVVSGGARGTDRIAMQRALESGGAVVGFLAEPLTATARSPGVREWLETGRLLLWTSDLPNAPFSTATALGRNRLIYTSARFAIVASSDYQTGGTWSGAIEALRSGWCPVFVRRGTDEPNGNRELVRRGAEPMREEDLEAATNLVEWMSSRTRHASSQAELLQERHAPGPTDLCEAGPG
jgi:predicted Rossmann fold nucleotide-binding protein DprA/Smf involved in DNA uptake